MLTKHDEQWIIEHSSLYQQTLIQKMIAKNLTLEQCKTFSQNNIIENLTKVDTSKPILEIGPNDKFCFMGRVDTSLSCSYNKHNYYQDFENRSFIAFSTITNENISHYENKNIDNIMFAYNVPAEAIVHVFPTDSNTWTRAQTVEKLTELPSLWWTLDELNEYTKKLRVYNQVTCKTKINGEILKPCALIVFNELTDQAKAIANDFNVNIILIHTNTNVINYNDDLMKDTMHLPNVSNMIYRDLGIDYYHFNSQDFF